mmetsp:Transcript_26704/g.61469  ORF Transcript_26704/g.61469 Transcript_26704/m.61469 type:complete len:743 (-) Transcript_26704:236-2464(-)
MEFETAMEPMPSEEAPKPGWATSEPLNGSHLRGAGVSKGSIKDPDVVEEWHSLFDEQVERALSQALVQIRNEHRKLLSSLKVPPSNRTVANSIAVNFGESPNSTNRTPPSRKLKLVGEHVEIHELDSSHPSGEVQRFADFESEAFPTTCVVGVAKKTFKMLNEWSQPQEASEEAHYAADIPSGSHPRLKSLHSMGSMAIEQDEDPSSERKGLRCEVLRPNSKKRILWDFLASLCLIAEVCLVPMAVFDFGEITEVLVFRVLVMFYWTLDLCANFFVGFHLPTGEVELRLDVVAKRYLAGWFIPDICLVMIDWLTYGAAVVPSQDGFQEMQPLKILRLGKLARALRVVRVLLKSSRILKLPTILSRIDNSVGRERTVVLLGIMKNVVMILLLNHFLACAWYWIGSRDKVLGWVAQRDSAKWTDDYAWAMYWSVANFTPGTSGIQPGTTEEVVFAVFILFFAMCCFSVFVSSTTALISRFAMMQYAQRRNVLALKRYLRQHKFPVDLRTRVLMYVKVAIAARKDVIPKTSVELLGVLSQSLKEELQLSLQLSTLGSHPLFHYLATANTTLMRKMSVEALAEVKYSRGDIIFVAGEICDKMGFIVSGVLDYAAQRQQPTTSEKKGESSSKRSQSAPCLVGPNDNYCEAALWTRWKCCGEMHADDVTDIIELNAFAFRRCVQRNMIVFNVVQGYAVAFIEVLNSAATGGLSQPLTDIQTHFLQEEPIQKLFQREDPSTLLSLFSPH